jgi:hypothetical protein
VQSFREGLIQGRPYVLANSQNGILTMPRAVRSAVLALALTPSPPPEPEPKPYIYIFPALALALALAPTRGEYGRRSRRRAVSRPTLT